MIGIVQQRQMMANVNPVDVGKLPDLRRKRLLAYLSKLGRLTPIELPEITPELHTLISLSTRTLQPDQIAYAFADILLKLGCPGYDMLSLTEVVDIWWDKHPTFKSVLHIRSECLLLWGCFGEFSGGINPEIVTEVVRSWKQQGRTLVVALGDGKGYTDLRRFLMKAADLEFDIEHTASEQSRRNF